MDFKFLSNNTKIEKILLSCPENYPTDRKTRSQVDREREKLSVAIYTPRAGGANLHYRSKLQHGKLYGALFSKFMWGARY